MYAWACVVAYSINLEASKFTPMEIEYGSCAIPLPTALDLSPCFLQHSCLLQMRIRGDVLLVLFDLELISQLLHLPEHGGHAHIIRLITHGCPLFSLSYKRNVYVSQTIVRGKADALSLSTRFFLSLKAFFECRWQMPKSLKARCAAFSSGSGEGSFRSPERRQIPCIL